MTAFEGQTVVEFWMLDVSNVHRPFSVAFSRREIQMFKIEMLGTQHVAPFVLLLQNYFLCGCVFS